MKIATWNVNSIRARLDNLYAWLKHHEPDVVCIQESKCMDHLFPWKELELLRYRAVYHGQSRYNGVAILSRHPIEHVYKGFVDGAPTGQDPQARLIAATVLDTRILSAYVPNGSEVGSKHFDYKLRWLRRLRDDYLDRLHTPEQPLLLCGDFNIAPSDLDVWNAALWKDSIITHEDARRAFEHVLDFGLHDTFRHLHPEVTDAFSWWDYSKQGFAENRGVRIDSIYATRPLLERCTSVTIDTEERARSKPSDHAPILATFS